MIFDGLGGIHHGSLFQLSDSVDSEKPPGCTSLISPAAGPLTPRSAFKDIVTGTYFFYSPNITWLLLCAAVWFFFPYNVQATSWQESLIERLLLNHVVILSYIGFWHFTLYGLGWGKRPFVADRSYSYAKLFHNMFYTELGVLQWAFTEAAFLHCYRTGKLQIDENLETSKSYLQLAIWSLAVPLIRDMHFYLAHRLIHTRFLYKYIHSVHHRNTDIEPFSGLCMHPCEHLYYFTCYAPLLLIKHHPFVLFWMGMHTVLTPAASHSGYEDHFSADLYHYCHHRYYECNYAGGIPIDQWFGTYRDKLKQEDVVPRDAKATLLGWPEYPAYQLLGVVLPALLLVFANDIPLGSKLLAFVVAFLPILSAAVLYHSSKPLAPFNKDSMFSRFVHISGGVVWGVLPAYYLIALVLS